MKILAEAPCRISLFGGSTDIPPFSTEYGGACVNMAINIRQRIVLNDYSEWDLKPQDNEGFFKKILAGMQENNSFGIKHEFNGAIGSGISTSAALAVALVGAVNKHSNMNMSKDEIAEKARDLEVNSVGLLAGRQDHYCAVYGGVNYMVFGEKTFVVPLGKDFISNLLPYIQLFYIGDSRVASAILNSYSKLTPNKVEVMSAMRNLALKSLSPIREGNIAEVARLLREGWELKKRSGVNVTNEKIDAIYKIGFDNGAMAGKILGAGGGGHIMFLVPPKKQPKFKELTKSIKLSWVDFDIDWQGLDCRII